MNKPIFTSTLGAGVLLLCLGGNAAAAEYGTQTSPSPAESRPQSDTLTTPLSERTPMGAVKTGESGQQGSGVPLVGRKVQNLQGELLGEVNNLLVTSDGRIDAVVLGRGGLMGIGQDHYKVPWSRVQWEAGSRYLTVDVPRESVAVEFSAFEPVQSEESRATTER